MLALLASLLLFAAPCKPLPNAVALRVGEKRCFKTPAVRTLELGSDPFDAEMTSPTTLNLEGVEHGTSTLTLMLDSNERLNVEVSVK